MKNLCGFVCLVVSVLLSGSLVAPLPSEAGTPTLTIDGLPVNLQQGGPGCGADNFINGTINGCYSIVGTNTTTDTTRSATLLIGGWYVGDVSSTNQARVLVNDVSPGTENMKITGVTFTSATNTFFTSNTVTTTCNAPTCDTVRVVLRNTFNAQNISQTVGPFSWQMAVGGYFDPPLNATGTTNDENAVSNRFRLAGQGCFNAVPCTPPAISTSNTGNNLGTIDSGNIGSPTTLNFPTYITRTLSSIYVDIDGDGTRFNATTHPSEDHCNTGNQRCQPTLLYDYEIRIHGKDTLMLTDSVVGCGGSCNPERTTNRLLKCEGLPTDNPKPLVLQCAEGVAIGLQKDRDDAVAAGAVEAQTCTGTCIIIFVRGTPPGTSALAGPFIYTASGPGVDSSFQMTLDAQAQQAKVFSTLQPQPPVGERCFIVTDFPPGGSKGDFQLDQVQFRSELGSTGRILYDDTNSNTKIGACTTNVVAGDRLYIEMHVH